MRESRRTREEKGETMSTKEQNERRKEQEGRYITVRGFRGLIWAGPGSEARDTPQQYTTSMLIAHYRIYKSHHTERL